MLRYTLSCSGYTDLVLTREDLPVNADSFKLTFSRSKTYYSSFRAFTIADKFHGTGKAWIDTIFDALGWSAEITVTVEMFDSYNFEWVTILDRGNVNLSKYNRQQFYTEVNFEDGSFQSRVANYDDIEIDYYSSVSIDDTGIPVDTDRTTPIQLRGLNNGIVADYQRNAILPFRAFRQVLRVITGQSSPLYSPELETGDYSKVMLASGKMIRGLGVSKLSFKLNDLFNSFNAFGCYGMGFENINGQTKAIIDKRSYFFNPAIIATIDELTDLQYELADDLMFSGLTVGYANYEKKEAANGLSEFNKNVSYTAPTRGFKNTMKIVSPYRGDGTTIERLRQLTSNATDDNADDNIFLIDCFEEDETGTIKSRTTEGFAQLSGVFNNYNLPTNARISPARMVKNWGSWLNACLRYFGTKKLKYNSQSTESTLSTRLTNEGRDTINATDININEFDLPYLSGRIVKFNCTFDAQTIAAISNNPNGVYKFYDYVSKSYNFGWGKETGPTIVDKSHNVELYECRYKEFVNVTGYLIAETGEPIINENGNLILLESGMAQIPTKVSQMDALGAISDNDKILVVSNGKNYQMLGSVLKSSLISQLLSTQFITIEPGAQEEINLGAYSSSKAYRIDYYCNRYNSFRTGMIGVLAQTTSTATLYEPGFATSIDGDYLGVTFTADVSSGQVRLIAALDDSNIYNMGLYLKVTALQ